MSGTSPGGMATCSSAWVKEPCHFILIFDNGYFSEFGTFSITDWLGHDPQSRSWRRTSGLPESAFDGFPKEEVYFARGSIPPAEIRRPPLQGALEADRRSRTSIRMLAQATSLDESSKGGREWQVDSVGVPDLAGPSPG